MILELYDTWVWNIWKTFFPFFLKKIHDTTICVNRHKIRNPYDVYIYNIYIECIKIEKRICISIIKINIFFILYVQYLKIILMKFYSLSNCEYIVVFAYSKMDKKIFFIKTRLLIKKWERQVLLFFCIILFFIFLIK